MLSLNHLSVDFADFSLKDISFEVRDGEYFILLGESGAGKSMILETIAGLITPAEGNIFLNDYDITRVRIRDRGIGLLFQDYAVFPHMSVRENIAYPIKNTFSSRERHQKIEKVAEKTGILHLLHRRPSTLSGGELQRVALARTLTLEPSILLLDEPLSALDPKLRGGLRSLLRKLNHEGITIVHVTHDYEEALSLANRIAVVDNGTIVQIGTPAEVFRQPRSAFIAHFIGLKNFYPAALITHDGIQQVCLDGHLVFRIQSDFPDSTGWIMIRSEEVILSLEKLTSSALNSFQGKITEIIPLKTGFEVIVEIGVQMCSYITEESLKKWDIQPGKSLWVSFKASGIAFIPD